MSQIAKDFGISESCLHRWVKRAEIEGGVREGLTLAEEAEIRELRKRNRGHESDRRLTDSVPNLPRRPLAREDDGAQSSPAPPYGWAKDL